MTITNAHILIVDDAREIREPLSQYLRKQGFRTEMAADAAQAREALGNGKFDLVVLDIMMPGEDGLSLCRWINSENGPPIILLTAMADETDRIVGLELGADDYLVKPFNPRELLARIRAVLRRVPSAPATVVLSARRFGDWVHDASQSAISHHDGTRHELTTAENRLLTVFLDRPNTVLSRDQLLDLTAGREAKAYDRAIDNQISRLRRKIETDPKKPTYILTEWGGGYRFAADVQEALA
ncbi:response regulator [Pseudahrensia aquimaris]|uniref:Response regulator n=1 Tax=Pseudahrensia aquimaris TaxID=744461 RepID=A0ABW3FG30_9HYPH